MPQQSASQRRKLRIISAAVTLLVAAQACYFAACVTVNWPDDRSDSDTRKLQSRVNHHSDVSAIFQKHGQSGLVMHRDTHRAKANEPAKKSLAEAPTAPAKPPLVIPHMGQFTSEELDHIASVVAQESKEIAFPETVELENVETNEITRTVGAQGTFVKSF